MLHRLGKGGMGIVYKAHDRSMSEVVAIKVLRSDAAATPAVAQRFQREISERTQRRALTVWIFSRDS